MWDGGTRKEDKDEKHRYVHATKMREWVVVYGTVEREIWRTNDQQANRMKLGVKASSKKASSTEAFRRWREYRVVSFGQWREQGLVDDVIQDK